MKKSISFIHTADLHLGAKFISLGEQAQAQREQLRATFCQIIKLAIDKKVDFVLFAGDTFDSNKPSYESIMTFKQGIVELASHNIGALIIGGTHDAITDLSILKSLKQELTQDLILLDDNQHYWHDHNHDVCVYGISLTSSSYPTNPLHELNKLKRDATCWQIGMVHGGMAIGRVSDKEAQVLPEEIKASQLDYIALGHWHNTQEYSQGKTSCWYAGSPELIAIDEKDQGNVLLVNLEQDQSPHVTIIPVGKHYQMIKEVDAGHANIEELIKHLIESGDKQALLTLIINGQVELDYEIDKAKLKEKLAKSFFHVRIKDKTHRLLSDELMSTYSDKTVVGNFVQAIKNELDQAEGTKRQELEQALQLGVGLMLGKEIKLWS